MSFAERHTRETGCRVICKQRYRRVEGLHGRASSSDVHTSRHDALVGQFCTREALTSVRRADRVASIVMKQCSHS